MIDEPIPTDPRLGDMPNLPHKDVDDPRKKKPAQDPEIRKGPLVEPPTKAPKDIDPPVEPHIPGDPAPAAIDPPVPGQAPADPGMVV
jgi:hypothetical protein